MATRTHCQRGHEFTPENTYRRADGSRRCWTCRKDKDREWLRARYTTDPEFRERMKARCRKNMSERYHSADPEVHRKVSAKREQQKLLRQRRKVEQMSEQPITPFGELVRSEIQRLGDRAWHATETRMR